MSVLKKVEIEVSGFSVVISGSDAAPSGEELADVAYELASGIGMRLADLGLESRHGEVTVRMGAREGSSGDV